MENYSLKVEKLSKKYSDFKLDEISFTVPKGNIVGFIGENGAGKTTTLDCILDIVPKTSGDIYFWKNDNNIKNEIGVVFDENCFPEDLTPKQLNNIFKKIYENWEEYKYFKLLNKFSLKENKRIKTFSKGMRTKLQISVALSHKVKLLILDEATSGLDPIARDEILDILLDFIQDEENSVLISSHITSDFQKVADYIICIHNGKIIFNEKKDTLIYDYGMIKCKTEDFNKIDKKDIFKYTKTDCMYEVLVKNKKEMESKYKGLLIDNVKIEEIMFMYIKGDN